LAEFVTEARLHHGAGHRVDGLAGSQDFVDDGWCGNPSLFARWHPLGLQGGVFAIRLRRLTPGAPAAAGAGALQGRFRPARYLLDDVVCLFLVDVSRNIPWKFCLYLK
jgi:hypothetical protein